MHVNNLPRAISEVERLEVEPKLSFDHRKDMLAVTPPDQCSSLMGKVLLPPFSAAWQCCNF